MFETLLVVAVEPFEAGLPAGSGPDGGPAGEPGGVSVKDTENLVNRGNGQRKLSSWSLGDGLQDSRDRTLESLPKGYDSDVIPGVFPPNF